jgi:hypothetical protein
MSFFPFTKSEKRRAEQILLVVVGEEAGTSGRGKKVGKEGGRGNIVQTLFIHVCKWKNDTY